MIIIKTNKNINATIQAPPSKSYTNRALIIAALAKGKSVLKNILISEDTEYMISALKEFGVKITSKGKDVAVYGTGGKLKTPKKKIYIGNAGTCMRFLTTFAALAPGKTMITGEKRMKERPIGDLIDALKQAGINAKSEGGFPPVTVEGDFRGGIIKLKSDVSSQFLSSILMCAPYAQKDVTVQISGSVVSKPYIDMTLDIMKSFGINVKNSNYKKFVVKTKKYKAKNYKIEGDASNASYFFAAAAITKGRVTVKNINPKSKQGDIKFIDLLKKMGCDIKKTKDSITVKGKKLKGIDIDMNQMPDVVMTLAVVAIFSEGETIIRNVANLRVKETDRLKALIFELRKIGTKAEELADGLKIRRRRLQKAIIETYNDHRMAMSFAVAGLVVNKIRIKNPSCVQKSFPDFWKVFGMLYKK